jgi:hypothetical protein
MACHVITFLLRNTVPALKLESVENFKAAGKIKFLFCISLISSFYIFTYILIFQLGNSQQFPLPKFFNLK